MKKRIQPRPKPRNGHRVQTTQVMIRVPTELHDRMEKLAVSIFQPVSVIIRMAMVEFVKNHKPAPTGSAAGITLDYGDGVRGKLSSMREEMAALDGVILPPLEPDATTDKS